MQQLRDKLAITDRAAKSEAQLKVSKDLIALVQHLSSFEQEVKTFVWCNNYQEKFQLRLKVLEETLRGTSSSRSASETTRSMSNGPSRRQSLGGSDNLQRFPSNGSFSKKAPVSQMRHSLSINSTSVLKNAKGTSKSFDGGTRSLDRGKALLNGPGNYSFNKASSSDDAAAKEPELANGWKETTSEEEKPPQSEKPAATEDSVPGVLYDLLQKEVVSLRKASHEKDQSLKDKDDAIEVWFLYCLVL